MGPTPWVARFRWITRRGVAWAGSEKFETGPIIENVGPVLEVDSEFVVDNTRLRVVYDVAALPGYESVSHLVK